MDQKNNSHLPRAGKVVPFKKGTTIKAKPAPVNKSNTLKTALPKIIMVLSVAFSLTFLVKSIKSRNEELKVAQKELEIVEVEHKKVCEENKKIKDEYQQTQEPDYLEEVARRDYFYSKPGEIVFDIDNGGKSQVSNNN